MRKIILYLHMSLDTVVSDLEKWMIMTDELIQESIEHYKTIDTVIFGSKTYPSMADYWQKAEKSSNSETEKELAKNINKVKKLVLSRSNVELTWENSELLNFKNIAELTNLLTKLKNQEGKDISVESGVGVWKLFLDNLLFDELILYIHPVIAGKGEKLFSDNEPKTTLKLKSTKSFSNGVLELHYEKNN